MSNVFMLSQASSPPLAAAVLPAALLAALGLSSVQSGAFQSLGPGCDTGKLYLDRDLPAGAVNSRCPAQSRPESSQVTIDTADSPDVISVSHRGRGLQSIDTVFDPEPARKICMNYPISYNSTIPNSGAFRPVMAENGEYIYCPPQRWLNNLHHGATVLLYHPCAETRERRLLSGLARSCLPNHVVTPHPQLTRDLPIALVSWGRTLVLPAVASPDVCDWLQATQITRRKTDGRTQAKKYNLLLTRSAELGPSAEKKIRMLDSVRRCCEQTISYLLRGTAGAVSDMEDYSKQTKDGRKNREIRDAIRDKRTTNSSQINESISRITADALNRSGSLGPASDPSLPRPAVQSEIQKQHRAFTPTPDTRSPSNNSESLRQTNSSQRAGANLARESTTRKTAAERLDVPGRITDHKVAEVQEREASSNPQPSPTKLHSSSHPEHRRQESQSSSDGCSNSTKPSGAERRDAAVNVGFQRTPRTDEAVWAAAALGFLLVLLTLSILHTRLYRRWRTTPSLYWHDPHLGYDNVGYVIRRRLKIAKKRRKRSRRQECVLLPCSSSSSSSDENP